jgi:hypothetical protein
MPGLGNGLEPEGSHIKYDNTLPDTRIGFFRLSPLPPFMSRTESRLNVMKIH